MGTLFATTVNVLWNRQLTLRGTINKEVCEVRLLRRALLGCYGTAQHAQRRATALTLLHSYVTNLQLETQNRDCIERLEMIQSSGGGISLNELDGTLHSITAIREYRTVAFYRFSHYCSHYILYVL